MAGSIGTKVPGVQLRVVPYSDPDAMKLVAEVQQEYVHRYGEQDSTPVDPAEFAPPHGLFVLGYADGAAVACGGWRNHGDAAEIKRMYVVPSARGHGYARVVLAELERTARAAGHRRCILETGLEQPEAIALYTSSGYLPIDGYGVYKCAPESRYYGKSLHPGQASGDGSQTDERS